jgi:ketosteroid isomerase-like protein
VVATTLHWRSNRESVESFRRYLELEGAPAALERIDREGLLAGRDSLTRRYAKYAKVIVQVGNGRARAFGRVAGHPLEFVPLSDPAAARVGDTLSARLLYMGRPLAGIKVHAGAVEAASALSDHPVVTAPDVDVVTDAAGVVRIPVSAAGAWNLRTIHIAQSPRGAAADWDAHWATLVFQVAEPVPSARADSAAVVGTIEAYHSALQRGDSIAALALLTPDAVILESGGLETKAEYRSHHLPGDIRFAQAIPRQRTPVSVSVRGNVAWAWSTSITQGEYQGRQINSASAELMVVTRTSSGWRISAIHWSSRARR